MACTSAKHASVKVKSEPKKQGTCTCRLNSIWSAAVSSFVCVYTVVTQSRTGNPESSMSDAHVHVLSCGLSDADGMHTCTVYLHVLHCRTRILSDFEWCWESSYDHIKGKFACAIQLYILENR